MARKNGIQAVQEPTQVFTCGDCVRAYGFCLKGADGLPICLRCSLDDRYLRMCSETACRSFERRGTPLPGEFSFGISGRMGKEAAV